MNTLTAAAAAVDNGDVIVYPTETVYGLGADATTPAAVRRVFEIKGRSRSDPISFAVPSVDAAAEYVVLTDRERAFMEAFLPGPVTVVCERRPALPSVLTAGRDRVGVRIPDHEMARELLAQTGPITATSANKSGRSNVREVAALDQAIQEAVAVTVDGGTTPGGESTVVDVAAGTIHRAGRRHDAVADWLRTH